MSESVHENPLEDFRMPERVFEGSKTLEVFPIVSNSETEKSFRISKTDFFLWKTFSVSELVTIGNSFKVFEPSETIFLFENFPKVFLRPTLKPIWVCEHLKVFLVGFSRREKYFRDEKIISSVIKILSYRCYSETDE
jgi:hypothetical protein